MTFLKDSLITLTILVISIWVMPATSTDDLKELKEHCRDIFKTIGFKDNSGDFEKLKNTAGETLNNEDYNRLEDVKGDHEKIDSTGKTLKQEDYNKLGDIYKKMSKFTISKEKKQSESKLELIDDTDVSKLDDEKIKSVTMKFETDFKNYLKDQKSYKNVLLKNKSCEDKPVTDFCESKINEENEYLKTMFK